MYYKVLNKNRMPFHGGSGQWPYRKWTTSIDPTPCVQGYHVCKLDQLRYWFGPEIWEVEIKGKIIESNNKSVVESARLIRRTNWNEKTARFFVADCAEHVLPIWEAEYPNDTRPHEAIAAARDYANGLISIKDLNAAAYSAASAASAVSAASAAYAASAASAVSAASAASAVSAASACEKEWQNERLGYYLNSKGIL